MPGTATLPVQPASAADGIVGRLAVEEHRLPEVITGLSRQNSAYRRIISVCEEVAAAALQGADVRELTSVFARIIRKTIVLLNPALELRCYAVGHVSDAEASGWNPADRIIARLLDSLATDHRPLRVPAIPDSILTHGCLATPVIVGETTLGYLLIMESSDADDDDVVLIASYVSTLFALTLVHERTSTDLGRRYQAAIVDSLVSGHFLDLEDARRKAHILGLASDQRYRVAVIRAQAKQPPEQSPSLASDEVEELIESIVGSVVGAVGAARDSSLVLILPEDSDAPTDQDRIATGVQAVMTRLRTQQSRSGGTGPTCGLSESTPGPDMAPQLLRQAETAIEIGTRIGRAGQVIPYDSLGIYRLLLQIGEIQQLWQFAEEVLGSLINYDATHKIDLLRTLSVYLSQRESLKRTARRLQVHTNTVSYRIQRIEQLSRLDLTDPDDHLLAHIAIKIIESQRANTRQRDPLSDTRCQ